MYTVIDNYQYRCKMNYILQIAKSSFDVGSAFKGKMIQMTATEAAAAALRGRPGEEETRRFVPLVSRLSGIKR